MNNDRIWGNIDEYFRAIKLQTMTPGEMLREFHETFGVERKATLGALGLIKEEYEEFINSPDNENELKELADLVYVIYGWADRQGWDLDEAIRRVHESNMSKLDPETGLPILREDGKILKGPNYKEPDLKDLVNDKGK